MNRIVILTGSPRKRGNSFQLADALSDGLEKKNCEVNRFDTAYLHIGGCRACGKCYSLGKPCIFRQDDFNSVAEKIEQANVLIFVTPVYWYTFPSHIKALIDRFYSFWIGKRLFTGKKCVLIANCGDAPISTFDGMVTSYRESIALLQGTNIGELLFPGVKGTDLASRSDVQEQLDELINKIAGEAEETNGKRV